MINSSVRRIGTSVGLAALLAGCGDSISSTRVTDQVPAGVPATYVLPARCARVLSASLHEEVGYGYSADELSVLCATADSSYVVYRRKGDGWNAVELRLAPPDGTYKK